MLEGRHLSVAFDGRPVLDDVSLAVASGERVQLAAPSGTGKTTLCRVLAGYLAINLIFGNILEPRIMGRGLGLSTLVVFLSLIFWGWLLGPVGMLLSVPLTIIVKIALEQTEGGQSIAVLLGDLNKA